MQQSIDSGYNCMRMSAIRLCFNNSFLQTTILFSNIVCAFAIH